MAIRLNSILLEHGVDLGRARLLRNQEKPARGRPSVYQLWTTAPDLFVRYQSTQSVRSRASLQPASLWVSFVVAPGGKTLLGTVFEARWLGPLTESRPHLVRDAIEEAGHCDLYDLRPYEPMAFLDGRLVIRWGDGTRSWIQRPDRQDKEVVELLADRLEPPFPGFERLCMNLSDLAVVPHSWVQALQAVRGIYLLTCPATKEQYVGSAGGGDGFWGRWQSYVADGHGGNVGLRSRDPSDYQVSILQVASSLSSAEELLELEALWKRKLQSRDMGLNRN